MEISFSFARIRPLYPTTSGQAALLTPRRYGSVETLSESHSESLESVIRFFTRKVL